MSLKQLELRLTVCERDPQTGYASPDMRHSSVYFRSEPPPPFGGTSRLSGHWKWVGGVPEWVKHGL